MKKLVILTVLSCMLAVGAASETTPVRTLGDALGQGKVSLNIRARWEHAVQSGRLSSDAITIRSRLGFATAPLAGFGAFLEIENITALDPDAYNQAGLNPAASARTVIADPETTEINQAWLEWADAHLRFRTGRQRLVFDNHRFVGDIGWRQNQQTFDAITIALTPAKSAAMTYAYVDKVHRVFGRDHAQGRWDSDSHLFNASYSGLPVGKLTGYAYALDFANAPAASSSTVGASVVGNRPVGDSKDKKINWRLEYARQQDHGNQPVNYSTDYLAAELGIAWKDLGASVVWEVLGADNGRGFATPLATLHAHNGWADAFLTTPAGGLRNLALNATGKLPGGAAWRAVWHDYSSDTTGADLGDEWNFQVSRTFAKRWTVLAKYADLDGRSGIPDIRKSWLEVTFNY